MPQPGTGLLHYKDSSHQHQNHGVPGSSGRARSIFLVQSVSFCQFPGVLASLDHLGSVGGGDGEDVTSG